MQNGAAALKKYVFFSKKKKNPKKHNIESVYDAATPLLGLYPELKQGVKDTFVHPCSQQHYSVAERRKQPTCPSTSEWDKQCRPSTRWEVIQP